MEKTDKVLSDKIFTLALLIEQEEKYRLFLKVILDGKMRNKTKENSFYIHFNSLTWLYDPIALGASLVLIIILFIVFLAAMIFFHENK